MSLWSRYFTISKGYAYCNNEECKKFESLFTKNGVLHLPDNIWLAYVLDPYFKGHMMVEEVKGCIVEKLRAMVAAIKRPLLLPRRSALFRDMLVSLQEADSSGAAEVVDEKPLLWWGENAYRYPCLIMIARKVLCIPATSASSERLFSLAGRTITEERSRLRRDLARNSIYLRANWVSTDVPYPQRSSSLKRPPVEQEERMTLLLWRLIKYVFKLEIGNLDYYI
eukprot:scaffold8220_cov150-Ochromonas_danica.AAC.2